MQYSRQEILTEIRKIFAEGPPISAPPSKPTSSSGSKSSPVTAAASTGAAAVKAGSAATTGSVAPGAKKIVGTAAKKNKLDWTSLDGEYEIKVKTVMALQNRNWWEKPEDWDESYYDEEGEAQGISSADKYKTTAAEPYQDMYQNYGYTQMYEGAKRILIRPGSVDYQDDAANRKMQVSNAITSNIGVFIDKAIKMHQNQIASANPKSMTVGGLTGGKGLPGSGGQQAAPEVAYNKHTFKNANNPAEVKQKIIDSLKEELGNPGIPVFYWPMYGTAGGTISAEKPFAAFVVVPNFASQRYAAKDVVKVSVVPHKMISQIAIGVSRSFYNWQWANAFGVVPGRNTETEKNDLLKYRLLILNNQDYISVSRPNLSMAQKKMDGHLGLLERFEKHLKKSLANDKIKQNCLKMVQNYIKYVKSLKKHIVFLTGATQQYADYSTHWLPLINYGGIVSDVQKVLWSGIR